MRSTHVSATSVLVMHKCTDERGAGINFSSFCNSEDTLKSIRYSLPRNSAHTKIKEVSRSLVQELSITPSEGRSHLLKSSLSVMKDYAGDLEHALPKRYTPASPLKEIACDMLIKLSISSDKNRLNLINEALEKMDHINDCSDPGYESQSSSPILTPALDNFHYVFGYPENSECEVKCDELDLLPNLDGSIQVHAKPLIISQSSQKIYHSKFSDCVKNRLNTIAERYRPLAEENLATESEDRSELVPAMATSAVNGPLAATDGACSKREVLDSQMISIKDKLKHLPTRREQLKLDVSRIQDKLRDIPMDFSFYEITHFDVEFKEGMPRQDSEYYPVYHRGNIVTGT